MRKNLPYDKTVVTEFKVHIADLLSRSVALKGSVASPIMLDTPFNKGDATVTAAQPVLIPKTTAILIVSSLEAFVLTMTAADGQQVVMNCRGLFVLNGGGEAVTISVPENVAQVRVQYIFS